MPIYLITNRVPAGFAPSEESMATWNAWFEKLGPHLADRGNPAFTGTALGNCGPGTTLGGYTLISAADLDEAVELASANPLVARGGGVEVGELTPLNKGRHLNTDYTKILHFTASPESVFDALTTVSGVSGWWSANTTGTATEGGELRLTFASDDPLILHVSKAARPSTVQWRVLECSFMPEWPGTMISFALSPTDSGGCELRFHHHGLNPELECYDQCSAGWNHFLPSLHEYVESGRGSVFGMPRIVEVSAHLPSTPDTVFEHFTVPDRYVTWMGREAILEPEPGGVYRVAMQDGFTAAGTFLETRPPHRLAFTWGWATPDAAVHVLHESAKDDDLPSGSTRVVVTLVPEGDGTRLTLWHENLPSETLVEAHRTAWRTYVDRLAIVLAGGDPGADPHH